METNDDMMNKWKGEESNMGECSAVHTGMAKGREEVGEG